MNESNTCYIASVEELFSMSGETIAMHLKEYRNETTSDSEFRSWCNSIPILVKVLYMAGLGELKLALEYETPIGSRIDAILLGYQRDSQRPLALIIELKQWTSIRESPYAESTVSVCISAMESRYEDRLHPVQQTIIYSNHLKNHHSNISNGMMDIRQCHFLHNFTNKQQLFEGNYKKYSNYRKYNYENVTFVKGEEEKLCEYVKSIFSPECCEEASDLLCNGIYVLGDPGFSGLKDALSKKENAVMIDDQIEVNSQIWRKLNQLKNKSDKKELIVISGEPGTGKTILGFHIIYTYYTSFVNAKPSDGKCMLSMPRSRTLASVIKGESDVDIAYFNNLPTGIDLLVVDEAHRIENLTVTMDKLFQKAKIIVVLQDDHQRIRPGEEGLKDSFIKYAKERNIIWSEYTLLSQKRSGYLGGYVSNLNHLLYDGTNEKVENEHGILLTCCDSLTEIDAQLRKFHKEGRRVKWYAPFCWPWSKSTKNCDIVIPAPEETALESSAENCDIVIPAPAMIFRKAWNPMYDQYIWYKAEREDLIDQVGCIYTAQGLEFDYIGVIWWNDLTWDKENSTWRIDLRQNEDCQFTKEITAFYGIISLDEIPLDAVDGIKELFLNIYRILLTRAKKGVYIWFHDKDTREHFEEIMRIESCQ